MDKYDYEGIADSVGDHPSESCASSTASVYGTDQVPATREYQDHSEGKRTRIIYDSIPEFSAGCIGWYTTL